MNRKRSQLQAYFAGIFDGEGHVSIHNSGSTYVSRMVVSQDDPQAVLLMAREYPEAVSQYRIHSTGKPYWVVAWNHYKGYQFLEDMLPFLLIKQEQAKVALSFLAHRRRDHGRKGSKGLYPCLRCERFAALVKEIRARDKGLKTVNALLDHEMREYRAKPEEVADDVRIMSARMRELQEGVETRLSESNKTMSDPEQEIVQLAA